jgi:hypothetical protein
VPLPDLYDPDEADYVDYGWDDRERRYFALIPDVIVARELHWACPAIENVPDRHGRI